MDFHDIGVNLNVGVGGDDLDNPATVAAGITEINDDFFYQAGTRDILLNSWYTGTIALTINGVNFYTGDLAAPRGTFGVPVNVTPSAPGDPNPVWFVMKQQIVDNNDDMISVVKEAIIGRALFLVSNTNIAPFDTGPACLNIYKIVKGREYAPNTRCYYILMEKGNYSLGRYLRNNRDELGPVSIRIAQWLEFLQTQYEYIHCDFKGDNILVDFNNHLRIIDYGWSTMIINGIRVTTKPLQNATFWRDFTLLFHFIGVGNNIPPNDVMLSPVLKNYIRYFLMGGVKPSWPGSNLWREITRHGLWVECYHQFLNSLTANNPRCFPHEVENYFINEGYVSNVAIASVTPPSPFAGPLGAAPFDIGHFVNKCRIYTAAAAGAVVSMCVLYMALQFGGKRRTQKAKRKGHRAHRRTRKD